MKKLLAILLACAALTCTAVGCGSKDSSSDGGNSMTEEAKSPVVGTWKLTGKSFDDLKADCDERDWKLKEVIVELDDSGNMDLTMRLYPYGDLYITETSLYVGKTEIPIDFDGKLVTYEENGKTYNVLEKIDPVDENDRNGRYKLLLKSVRQQMGIPDDFECELELINKDEGYICVVTKGKYEYNEDEKKMFIDGDDDPSIVEFNGDNMTLTDSDGEVEEYERIK